MKSIDRELERDRDEGQDKSGKEHQDLSAVLDLSRAYTFLCAGRPARVATLSSEQETRVRQMHFHLLPDGVYGTEPSVEIAKEC